MFCSKCGLEIKSDLAYCPVCGNALPVSPGYKPSTPESTAYSTVGLTGKGVFLQFLYRLLFVYEIAGLVYFCFMSVKQIHRFTNNGISIPLANITNLLISVITIGFLLIVLFNLACRLKAVVAIIAVVNIALSVLSFVDSAFIRNDLPYSGKSISYKLIFLALTILLSFWIYVLLGILLNKKTEKIVGLVIIISEFFYTVRICVYNMATLRDSIITISLSLLLGSLPLALIFFLHPVISEPLIPLRRS